MLIIMVRIEFFGAWEDGDMQTVRDVTAADIEKKLKISVLPAYFEEEYSLIEENNSAFSENCAENEKIALAEQSDANEKSAVKVRSEKKFGNGVKITISLFPAGNGRMRRQTAQEITENIALKTGIPKDNISVTLNAPPQERRSYAEER